VPGIVGKGVGRLLWFLYGAGLSETTGQATLDFVIPDLPISRRKIMQAIECYIYYITFRHRVWSAGHPCLGFQEPEMQEHPGVSPGQNRLQWRNISWIAPL
jgi:hypothetical protein